MNVSDALIELGQMIGQPGLGLGEDGTCRLMFDGRLSVDFDLAEDGKTLWLTSVVSLLELEDSSTLAALLKANLLGASTGGGYFSLSSEGEVMFEQRLEMAEMDLTGFYQAVETYVNHLDGWEDRISSGELSPIRSSAMLLA